MSDCEGIEKVFHSLNERINQFLRPNNRLIPIKQVEIHLLSVALHRLQIHSSRTDEERGRGSKGSDSLLQPDKRSSNEIDGDGGANVLLKSFATWSQKKKIKSSF